MDAQRNSPIRSFSGIGYALLAAILFGASTPFSKLLLGRVDPVALAGWLYFSSGLSLAVGWWARRWFKRGHSPEASLTGADLPWLGGAVLAGGVAGPIFLMVGLVYTPASTAALLLNLEGVFTAALAWFVFREPFDRRIALGMAAIIAGGGLLSWAGRPPWAMPWGALSIAAAGLAWAIDNNLTRKISAGDPFQIAAAKGLVAGLVNLLLAQAAGAPRPNRATVLWAALVGFLGYGLSLTFFVRALRSIGTARTSAYFSLAPFIGAALSIIILGDRLTFYFILAAALMGFGLWLHLTERHEHEHGHEAVEHEHSHRHDEHHQHGHDERTPSGEPHSHRHVHKALRHGHPHYPDIHHRHGH